jgi:uncharacterized protein DUF5666
MISKRVLGFVVSSVLLCAGIAQAQSVPAPGSPAKPFGTVKMVNGNTITLTTNGGNDVDVSVQDSTRLVKMAPGQKDLKTATPIQLPEVQVGDRVLVLGTAADDGKSVLASSVIVMKKTDIADKQQHDREDWQKRGVGGPVRMIDPATGTITISNGGSPASKPLAIHTSKETIIRRYSADSINYADAKPATIDQLKVGDQMTARGSRNSDGTEINAEEMVFGTFRNITGTVISVDPAKNTVSILDLVTRKPAVVQLTTDSQVRKLPVFVAQRIALRLRGISPEAVSGAGISSSNTPANPTASPASNNTAGSVPGANAGGQRQGGGADFQQMLGRMPQAKLADLQKGDAVYVLASQGEDASTAHAITLVSGIEPIITASPSSASVLSPWSLSSGGDPGAQ